MAVRSDYNEKTENEILQERAEVLGRAGEALSVAIHKMQIIEGRIHEALSDGLTTKEAVRSINRHIRQFNIAREHAKLRFYYLIVTREAMGFRKHTIVEDTYRISPRKKPIMRKEWIGIKNSD
jgi:hypothetical protein